MTPDAFREFAGALNRVYIFFLLLAPGLCSTSYAEGVDGCKGERDMQSMKASASSTSTKYSGSPTLTLSDQVRFLSIEPESITTQWETSDDATGVNLVIPLEGSPDTLFFPSTIAGKIHTIKMNGLSPASFYKLIFQCWNNFGDTLFSREHIITTASLSSGRMEVFFNNPVNTTFSNGSLAKATTGGELLDALVNYIDSAKVSIDVALYSNGRNELIQALKRAVSRGVRVRYITDPEPSNSVLNESLPFSILYADGVGLMHHKFIVIDPGITEKALVWTGSTNFSTNQVFQDPNNSIAIQDQALALAYTIEFEEIWGSEGPNPDLFNSKRGSEKLDNTPHWFSIDGKMIELYFSPSDGTQEKLINTLNSSDHSLMAGVLIFTRLDIAEAIQGRHALGVQTRVIIDDLQNSSQPFSYLQSQGIPVKYHEEYAIFHHKYVIIDDGFIHSDPVVVTGSHNWTLSANTRNDENLLIIHDADITNIYRQEFEARWAELTTGVAEPQLTHISAWPNPVGDFLHLQLNSMDLLDVAIVEITDVQGRSVRRDNLLLDPGITLEMSDMKPGFYFLTLKGLSHYAVFPFIKN